MVKCHRNGKLIPSPAGDIQENWDSYIADMLSSSPFLSSYLIEVERSIFPHKLRAVVLEQIKRQWPELVADGGPRQAS